MAAHRSGRSSLEFRLRDASHIRTRVIQLVDDLTETLREGMEQNISFTFMLLGFRAAGGRLTQWRLATAISSGERLPFEEDPGDPDDEYELPEIPPGVTEMSQLLSDIVDVVDCLFRLTISIQNPTPHDRFRSMTLTSTSYYEPSDIAHVRERFPSAPQTEVERLGVAISRRRQYFKYRELHHQKLARGLGEVNEPRSRDDGEIVESTVASSLPEATRAGAFSDYPTIDEDTVSESGWTDTTGGLSLVDGERPKIPPMPKEAGDRPFECPFCYMIISVSTTKTWMHSSELTDVDALVETSEGPKPLNTLTRCPLCSEQLGSLKEYAKHVGQHQRDLALFALPRLEDDDERPDEEVQSEDEDNLLDAEAAEDLLQNPRERALKQAEQSSEGIGASKQGDSHGDDVVDGAARSLDVLSV
ncbi:hypothetical protein OQA88_5050 [Cercophora sp. LCS_1]